MSCFYDRSELSGRHCCDINVKRGNVCYLSRMGVNRRVAGDRKQEKVMALTPNIVK